MLLVVALVAVVLAARASQRGTGTPGGGQQQPRPPGNTTPVEGPGQIAKDVVGALTGVVGAGVALYGALGGTAAATATGTAAAAAGGEAAAAAEGGAAAATGGAVSTDTALAGSIVAGSFFAELGVAAIFMVVVIAIFVTAFTITQHVAGWDMWVRDALGNWLTNSLFQDELDTIRKVVNPDEGLYVKVYDPSSGKNVNIPKYFTDQEWVERLAATNGVVNEWVPRGLKLSTADELLLRRFARWRAIVNARAYNNAQWNFWNSLGQGPNFARTAQRAFADFDSWVNTNICIAEPYAAEIGGRCGVDLAGLDAAMKKFLGVDYDWHKTNIEFLGMARALRDAALQGYSFGWPGDGEYSRQIVARSFGLDAANMGYGQSNSRWSVDYVRVSTGFRFITIDAVTRCGVDIVASREQFRIVILAPAQIGVPPGWVDGWVGGDNLGDPVADAIVNTPTYQNNGLSLPPSQLIAKGLLSAGKSGSIAPKSSSSAPVVIGSAKYESDLSPPPPRPPPGGTPLPTQPAPVPAEPIPAPAAPAVSSSTSVAIQKLAASSSLATKLKGRLA